MKPLLSLIKSPDRAELPSGGTSYVPQNSDHVAKGYKKGKGDLDPRRHGRELGLKSVAGMPLLEDPAQPFKEIVENFHDANLGHANSVAAHAIAELESGELDDLNEDALKAATEHTLTAEQYSYEQQATQLIKRRNEARNNLVNFEIDEGQDSLSEGDYDLSGTLARQMSLLFLAVMLDGVVNSFAFAPAMPQGLLQALVTSFFSSAAIACCGVVFGTGLRYFNYHRDRIRRLIWRYAGGAAALAALVIAVLLSQYRALLEASDSEGDAASSSVFTVAPSIVELPVFVGSIIVFAFAVLKFRGGPGAPWARHGDHAAFDRAYRFAQSDIDALSAEFTEITRQICEDSTRSLHEANESERERLKEAKATSAKAKLTIADIKNSQLKVIRAAEPDFAAAYTALLIARPDLHPEDLPIVELRDVEDFPDPTELDEALERAEAAFAKRTAQLAELEKVMAALATKTQQRFAHYLINASRKDDNQRDLVRPVKIQMKGRKS